MSPIAGFTRFRRHCVGVQSAFGTAATPTRAPAWRGVPEINPNWTDQEDVDVGSIDVVLPPYWTTLDITVPITAPLAFDELPIILSGGLKGGVTPTGGGPAKTWTYHTVSLTAT